MRETNYMIFSRETMKEIVEDYMNKKHNMKVKVEEFGQRKHHRATMYEAKFIPETHEGTNSHEE